MTFPRLAGVLAAILALGLCACAGTPAETRRLVPDQRDAVQGRIIAAMTALGFTGIVNDGKMITGRAVRAPSDWAACSPALVGRSNGDHSSRRFVAVSSRQATVRVDFIPEGEATTVDVEAAFSASYVNPEKGGSFDQPCRSKSFVEARLLEAAG
jgi:hypothetical protein